MKVLDHESLSKDESTPLTARPLRVFVTRGIELQIEKGDSLGSIVKTIAKHVPKSINAADLVAYWFALGERIVSKKHSPRWSSKELSTKPGRRYLA